MATEIHFGTSGWRAVMADEFTFANVRRAVTGIARYVVSQKASGARVIVGRDPRFLGETFCSMANEILIAMRNMLNPRARLYLIASQNAILLSAPPAQQALAQKIIADLDHPHRAYRLTFTLASASSTSRLSSLPDSAPRSSRAARSQ